jgi:cytoskeletal protein CcmA (bactofilin family)
MFNKSGVFGRNEPANQVTRRDLPAGPSTVSSSASPDRSAGRSVPTIKDAVAPSPAPAVEAVTPPAATEAVPAGGDVMGARLIVGPDVKLKGAEILDCDTLVVEGRVEATMDSRVIRIAENGSFSGKVSIDIAEIHGTFEGELTARSQLIIHSTGRVSGTIRYGKLVADEGGELCGDINVISASPVSPSKAANINRDAGIVLGVVSA